MKTCLRAFPPVPSSCCTLAATIPPGLICPIRNGQKWSGCARNAHWFRSWIWLYQGFAEGIDADAVAVRAFSASGLQFFASSSFSKNFSCTESGSAPSIVTASKDEAARVMSH